MRCLIPELLVFLDYVLGWRQSNNHGWQVKALEDKSRRSCVSVEGNIFVAVWKLKIVKCDTGRCLIVIFGWLEGSALFLAEVSALLLGEEQAKNSNKQQLSLLGPALCLFGGKRVMRPCGIDHYSHWRCWWFIFGLINCSSIKDYVNVVYWTKILLMQCPFIILTVTPSPVM